MQTPKNRETFELGLGTIFSGVFVLGLNVAMSGYIWGRFLSLTIEARTSSHSEFLMYLNFELLERKFWLDLLHSLFIFCSWHFLHESANKIFVINLEFTQYKVIACELLATLIMLVICLFALILKIILMFVWSKRKLTQMNNKNALNNIV